MNADALGLGLMIVALLAAIVARALLAAAREHVKQAHPDWYEALGAPGPAWRIGGPDERARRRLSGPLIFGPLPSVAAADPTLRRIARDVRLALGLVAICAALVVAIAAL